MIPNPCAAHAEPIGWALDQLHLFVSDHAMTILILVQVGIPVACVVIKNLFCKE